MKTPFMDWNTRWKILFLLLISVHCVKSDIFHHYKLKKFLTAVAFARALGRRPTILPVPIPIPIPIAQNEVIKIPAGGAGKTMVIGGGSGTTKDTSGIAQILSGGSSLSNLGSGITGSSSYGYQLPGTSNPSVINLSSLGGMTASESNIVNLAALGGNGNSGGNRILIIGPKGNLLGSSNSVPSIIHLGNMGTGLPSGMNFGMNSISPDLTGLNMGLSGMNFGGGFQGSNDGYGVQSSQIFRMPQNVYSDMPRRRLRPKFQGRRMRGSSEEHYPGPKPFANMQEDSHYEEPYRYLEEGNSQPNNMQRQPPEKYKKPIPVGEKFAYRP